jgi:hypothetical protein
MAQCRIANKLHLVRHSLIAAVALSTLASPASAQAVHEFYGPVQPLIFDAEGARHWCVYGYYGPFRPPMTSNDSNIISCQMGSWSEFFPPFHHHLHRQRTVLEGD